MTDKLLTHHFQSGVQIELLFAETYNQHVNIFRFVLQNLIQNSKFKIPNENSNSNLTYSLATQSDIEEMNSRIHRCWPEYDFSQRIAVDTCFPTDLFAGLY